MVRKGLFDFKAEAAGEFGGAEVIDLAGVDDDPELAAGLEGVGFANAVEGVGHLFQEADALGVGLEGRGAGPGAGAGGRVGDHDQRSVKALGFDFAVVGGDGVDDAQVLAEAAEEGGAGESVAAAGFGFDRLAEVMQEPGALRRDRIDADLRREHRAKLRDFDGVGERVLVGREAEVQPAEQLFDGGVHRREAEVADGVAAEAAGVFHHFVGGGADAVFDESGRDAAVLHDAFERDARDLPADRIEAGNHRQSGGFVDEQRRARGLFEGADVAAFAADQAALHVLVGERDRERRRVLRRRGRQSLHRREQRAASLVVDVLFDLVEQPAAEVLGLFAILFAEVVQEQFASLFRGDLGEALEFAEQMVAMPGGFAGKFGGGLGFDFGGGLQPGRLVLLALGLGVKFGRLDGRLAAGQLDFRAEARVADGSQGILTPFGHRIGHDGSGGERHGGEDALVGCHRHVRREIRRSGGIPLRMKPLPQALSGGSPCVWAANGVASGMSQHLDDERSPAAVWWDNFANFAWRTDWTQVVIILFLSGLGVVAIQSAGSARESTFYRSQIVFVLLGWVAYWAVSALDYREIQRYARRVYLLTIALLVPVSLCALLHRDLGSFIRSINGARRWMDFGPFSIQPSEFAKIGALVFLAALLARSPIGSFRATWRTVLWCLAIAAVPFVLIFVQPDLGSALIYLPLSFILLFVAGLTYRFFLVAGAAALLLVGVVALDMREYAAKIDQYAKANPSSKDPVRAVRGEHEAEAWFFLLKDYQRERIMSFVAPEVIDPKGLGVTWNVNQAVIAVGRGGFRGQGIGNGTQARFGYLPEAAAHNDFLFSGMAEEIGFTGGLLVIGAFVLLFWRVVRTAARAADRFGSLLAIGAAVVLGTHVVINVGMNIDLMPVTGVPLPFLSYGGSFVLSCFLLLGLVQSVHRHSAGGGEGGGSPATGLTA